MAAICAAVAFALISSRRGRSGDDRLPASIYIPYDDAMIYDTRAADRPGASPLRGLAIERSERNGFEVRRMSGDGTTRDEVRTYWLAREVESRGVRYLRFDRCE